MLLGGRSLEAAISEAADILGLDCPAHLLNLLGPDERALLATHTSAGEGPHPGGGEEDHLDPAARTSRAVRLDTVPWPPLEPPPGIGEVLSMVERAEVHLRRTAELGRDDYAELNPSRFEGLTFADERRHALDVVVPQVGAVRRAVGRAPS